MNFLYEGLTKAIDLLLTGDPETFSAVWATLKVSAYSMFVGLGLGIPLGFALGYLQFSLKKQVCWYSDFFPAGGLWGIWNCCLPCRVWPSA
jgi:ABC-type tungstate transport system substrate-binding protein